jgi:calcineurin-like phosphoesterase family protein
MTTYCWSDIHLDHRNIILFCRRPYSSVEEMQRDLIARHNAVVKPEDTVWCFGDVAFKEKNIRPFFSQLNGTHCLVPGNHDKCWQGQKKYEAAVKRYLEYGFKEVVQETRLGMFKCCHFPYEEDERHGARYAEWRPKDEGDFLLHGHPKLSFLPKIIHSELPMEAMTEQEFFVCQSGEVEFRYYIRHGAVFRILVADTDNLPAAILAAQAFNCDVVELLSETPDKAGNRKPHSVWNAPKPETTPTT